MPSLYSQGLPISPKTNKETGKTFHRENTAVSYVGIKTVETETLLKTF
jgi:hypothetical protein